MPLTHAIASTKISHTMSHFSLHHTITNPEAWKGEMDVSALWLKELVALTLEETLQHTPLLELSFLWTDDATMRLYNRNFRGIDQSTNVLSFPSYEKEALQKLLNAPPQIPLPLGDIALAYETIRQEACRDQKPFLHHLSHLLVHGILHLLGYDHEEEAEAVVMEEKEIAILAQKAIPNPYRSWQIKDLSNL